MMMMVLPIPPNGQVHAALALQCRMHSVRRDRSPHSGQQVTRINTHKMAKKIEGFTVKDSGEMPNITQFPPNDCPQCVTVVLHEHRHERVFTESEVRAYGDDLLSAHMSPGQIVDRADDYEEPLYRWIDRAIKAVNAKHGLSDPA